MGQRWSILSVLFLARFAMAFQFQSVAALSPLLVDRYVLTLTDIGLLIGLYLGPGMIVAIPGGSIAARFGDKRVVGVSLCLMLLGALMIWVAPGWEMLIAGRVIAGIGGVVINIVMTKMVIDWFTGHEIGTAMAIFISSWPLGIAVALLTLPGVAVLGGLGLAWIVILSLVGVSLIAFLAVYRSPEAAAALPVLDMTTRLPWAPLILAAILWALYNTAFAMVFGFGPLLLTEQGLPAPVASSLVSVFILLVGIILPLGGIIADRTGRRDLVILVSLLGYAVILPLVLVVPLAVAPWVLALSGLLFGLGAGPIMTMPSQVLRPQTRVFGMGVFYAIYYGLMLVGPTLAGGISDRVGRADAALMMGVVMVLACIAVLALFRRKVAPR